MKRSAQLAVRRATRLLSIWWRWGGKPSWLSVEALRAHLFSVRFKNVHIACCYECPPNRVNVFERGITLPGRVEESLAATTPCRLQLSAVLQIWNGKVRPITRPLRLRGGVDYSSTVSLTSVIDGVGGQGRGEYLDLGGTT